MQPSNLLRRSILCMFVLSTFTFSNLVLAESNLAENGGSAKASIKFQVVIPESLSLQIGTVGQDYLPEKKPGSQLVFFLDRPFNKQKLYIKGFGNIKEKRNLHLTSSVAQTDAMTHGHRKVQHYILCSP